LSSKGSIKNKYVFITGATAGIGKACAELFAQCGYSIIATGRRANRLKSLKKNLENKYSVNVVILTFDVRNCVEVTQSIETISHLNIQVLINNAGLAAGLAKFQDAEISDFDSMIDTNLKGLLYISKAIVPLMLKQKCGHIINVASIAGKEIYPNGNVYCASKFAVDALSRAMRIDLNEEQIKVTNIAPGMVETEFSLVRFKGDIQKAAQTYKGIKPLSAKDIANTILWAFTQPKHVHIHDIVLTPTFQASARDVKRT
jgi:3-hydroxy acid dehydrogenase / malonic semialdehyde reductase